MTTAVTAVVFGSRGGARLARALAGVDWAEERIVLDPADRLRDEALPAGVRRVVVEAALLPGQPWVLLLGEDDVAAPALAGAVGTALAAADPPPAFRLPQEVAGFGGVLRLRRAPVRLARAGTPLAAPRAVGPELDPGRHPCGRLPVGIRTCVAVSLAGLIDDLEADAAALAALWRARRVPVRMCQLVGPPFAVAGRVLLAPAVARARWARWSLAVIAGFSLMVARAKLWELTRTGSTA